MIPTSVSIALTVILIAAVVIILFLAIDFSVYVRIIIGAGKRAVELERIGLDGRAAITRREASERYDRFQSRVTVLPVLLGAIVVIMAAIALVAMFALSLFGVVL